MGIWTRPSNSASREPPGANCAAGRGGMRLGDEEAEVRAGDCVAIPPGAPHHLWAGPDEPLVLLCACAPPYSDEGTTMLGGPQAGLNEATRPDERRIPRSGPREFMVC